VIITIDGPAGTGKSSVARDLATELGLEILDTGAMYRAAAAIVLERSLSLDDPAAVAAAVRDAELHFEWDDDPPTLFASGEPVRERLREPDVSAIVSPVSKLPEVRAVLVEKQRRIGESHPRLVSEGRDQGSVVFPDADVKFYLDASASVRAMRRLEQLRSQGHDADAASIRREIEERDRRDSTRAVGPLVCPDDAVRVMTDELDRRGVVKRLVELVSQRVPAERLAAAARAG
jgi:cytidylate kinase